VVSEDRFKDQSMFAMHTGHCKPAVRMQQKPWHSPAEAIYRNRADLNVRSAGTPGDQIFMRAIWHTARTITNVSLGVAKTFLARERSMSNHRLWLAWAKDYIEWSEQRGTLITANQVFRPAPRP
jgi:hypothetical protein